MNLDSHNSRVNMCINMLFLKAFDEAVEASFEWKIALEHFRPLGLIYTSISYLNLSLNKNCLQIFGPWNNFCRSVRAYNRRLNCPLICKDGELLFHF